MHLPLFFAKCNKQHLELTLSCGSSSSRREIIPAAKQDHSQFGTALDVNVPFSSKIKTGKNADVGMLVKSSILTFQDQIQVHTKNKIAHNL